MLERLLKNKAKKIASKNKALNKIMKYVDEPNELDIQVKQIQKTISKQGRYIEELEKEVAILKKDSHPAIKGLEERLNKLEKEK